MKRLAFTAVIVALAAAGCARDAEQTAPTAAPQPSGTPTASSTPAEDCRLEGAGTTTVTKDVDATETALLSDIDYNTAGCPRVVFSFENETPSNRVEYQDPPPTECGSGEEVDTSTWGASAYLVFHASGASGADQSGSELRITYEGERDIAVSSPILKRIHDTCDFEAELEWIIALDAKRPFKVFTLDGPPRIVIDIQQAT